ncbi:DUF3080 family protein [Amphritea balenae]|nr:DUF3080 family protein [Amphritea balenae]GGK83042.1 hypothetical protein GCM10007941_36940 [Amphritea balenae]
MMETYSSRLANSLNSDKQLDLSSPLKIPVFPRRRDRILPVKDLRQGLLEVFNLRHCRLIHLVAERNSSLGKVMPPSKQLVYEIELFIGLRDCLQQLKMANAEPELITQVESIFRIKSDNFEKALWNGIFISEAVERNFSLSEPALSLDGEDGFQQSVRALEVLDQIAALNKGNRDWTRPEALDQMEQQYQTLYNHRYGSRWLRSLYLVTQTLRFNAELIQHRLQQRPLCYNQTATSKANIVKNVFQKYYISQLQPYMARLDQQGKIWLRINTQLINQFTVTPASTKNYYTRVIDPETSQLWHNYLEARNQHTKAWQNLLRQCGLMPKR